MKNVLIIGANGFIGHHLTKELLALKFPVNLTLFSRKFSPRLLELSEKNENVELIEGDYNELLNLVPIINNQDFVYHLVSSSFPSNSWNNPTLDITTNLIPSINLFKLCSDLGVKKIVFISSGGTIYGKKEGVLTEEAIPNPFSPYGIIKLTIEGFLEYFRTKSNLNYDIYRLSNPYGPHHEKIGLGVINTWLKAIKNKKPIYIYGDGNATKDYIYVEDAAKLLTLSIFKDFNSSEIYNISSGEIFSLNELIDIFQNVLNVDLQKIYKKVQESDNLMVKIDNKKVLREYQKFKSFEFTSIKKGIELTYNALKEDHINKT